MSFLNPWYFLLIVLVLGAIVYILLNIKRIKATFQWSQISAFKSVAMSPRVRFLHLPLILKTLGLVCIIFALARPQMANTKVKKNIEGIDILIALDISDSMLIEDMMPTNRLESAKETINQFVDRRTSDRIGVVIFAGEAFTLVPPTLDYQLIKNRVAEITTAASANIKDGTALGVAMANAAGRLKDSTAKTRVIIFLTDGENNSGTIDPETGLEIAKGYGLKVYSIGIGKDGPTKIPIYARDAFGQKVKTYQPFESHVNEELLGRMASETGGKYFRAETEDSLPKVFKAIDELEKTKLDVSKFTKYDELFQKYLLWGLLLYMLGVLLEKSLFRRAV